MSKTVVHGYDNGSGALSVEHDNNHPGRVFLHMSSGGFSHCVSLSPQECRVMAEALLKGAYAIEAAQPEAEAA